MKAASNSTPLIYFAKLNKFSLLVKIFDEIIIPQEVFDEVVTRGNELNRPEVVIIEGFIQKKSISVKETKTELKIETLQRGELAAISLALKLGIKNILIDDKEGVEVCKVMGLKPWRTTAIMLEMLKRGIISINEFKDLLVELSRAGYYLRLDIFESLIKEAREAKGKNN